MQLDVAPAQSHYRGSHQSASGSISVKAHGRSRCRQASQANRKDITNAGFPVIAHNHSVDVATLTVDLRGALNETWRRNPINLGHTVVENAGSVHIYTH